MKRKLQILLVLLCTAFAGGAQALVSAAFASSAIPDALKQGADAVYRLDEAVLDITSPSKYTFSVHEVVTILNADGAAHLRLSLPFDKFNKISDVGVTLYNSVGQPVRKYTKSDFAVHGYDDGFSLARDDKIMQLTAAAPEYPCTIEYMYVQNVTGYIELPDWAINNASSAVEQFRYVVKVPVQNDIRFTTTHLVAEPVITTNDAQKIYTWDIKNIAVQKIQKDGYEGGAYLPVVKIAPTNFEYDGYKGSFKSWNDFGQWCYSLYEQGNPFSAPRTEEIKAMAAAQPGINEKIAVLYDYLKKNMRYVSIQFGIGGFKPFPAKFVDEKKYGDCKALTNYMRCLLAVAGIKAYPALINAGYNKLPVRPEFPEDVFNHVILCVPNGNDSVWLECTSTNSDPGFLGSFTENKNALLLTEAGGFLVRTPASDFKKNRLATATDVVLNEDGAATATTTLTSSGSYYEMIDAISQLEPEKQSELFVQYLRLKQPDVFKLSETANEDGIHAWTVATEYEKLLDFKAGNKLFFPDCVQALCTEDLTVSSDRNIEYVFHFPYEKVDTTIFHFPAGYSATSLPKPLQVQVPEASYNREVRSDAASNSVTVISTLTLKKNVIAPTAYQGLSEFFDQVQHAEAGKWILEKK